MTTAVMTSPTWLQLHRVVRFGDTDAAGVMHFHQLLRWCHEAWEESLEARALPPKRCSLAAAARNAGQTWRCRWCTAVRTFSDPCMAVIN